MTNTPLTYTSAHVAAQTGIAETTVRSIIRQECASLIPDELRFFPGGRVEGKVLLIWAGIFDQVTSGRAIARQAPAAPITTMKRLERAS
jgi:hypothetical protein